MKIYQVIREFVQEMKDDNMSAFASGAAFFIFLSLVPILMVICSIIPYTPLTEENLLEMILQIIPSKLEGIFISIVGDVYQRSKGVLSVAVLVTLWSAGKGIMAVERGLNVVNGVKEQRNYFLVRIISSLYTVILIVMIILTMVIVVFGNDLIRLIAYRIPRLESVFLCVMNLRFLMGWIFLTLIFGAFYAYLPDKKRKFRYQLPGALFSSAIWSVFSYGFSIYVDFSKSFHIYGSLSIIVIFMVWMYSCIYIMFIGAYLNKYLNNKFQYEIKKE